MKLEKLFSSPPTDTIQDILEEKSIDLSNFAEDLGISKEKFEFLMLNKLEITDDIASRLSKILGSSKEFWITRYERYERSMRAKSGKGL